MNSTSRREILRTNGISKAFGSVVALNEVNIEVYENEIVGLVGDNGAGKSTLIKIIAGNYQPDSGELFLDGEPVKFTSPVDARNAGIETVYQDLGLCENLDSVANFFIGRELYRNVLGFPVLKKAEMERQTVAVVDKMGIDIPSVREEVQYLSGGQRQAIALAKFVAWKRKLILLDEPTAALGVREARKALDLIQNLGKEKGMATIMVAHNLEQVFSVVDRIIVLRHGEVAGTRERDLTTKDEIVRLITGAGLVNENQKQEGGKKGSMEDTSVQ